MKYKVTVVYVIYKPETKTFRQSFNSIAGQVDNIIVVDNSSYVDPLLGDLLSLEKVFYIANNENLGIAKATNIGVEYAINNFGANGLLVFSDQDTIYAHDYIDKVIDTVNGINDAKVAVYTPYVFDNISSSFKKLYVKRNGFVCREYLFSETQEIYQAIASGMVINLMVLSDPPSMCDELFIDWVDFHWCWEVNNAGYKILAVKDLVIKHAIGDDSTKLINVSSKHSSLRNYYIVRNGLYLSLYSKNINILIRFQVFMKSMLYIPLFLLNEYSAGNFKMLMKGCFHALTKRLGKYD